MPSRAAAMMRGPTNRWLQLVIAIVCMVMIANLQYGWTFVCRADEQGAGLGRFRHPVRV
jgi:hypothetical protein